MSEMRIEGNSATGGNLVGEVKVLEMLPNIELFDEIEKIMEKYKINYMWFAWNHWATSSLSPLEYPQESHSIENIKHFQQDKG